jgi:hypothetical protein
MSRMIWTGTFGCGLLATLMVTQAHAHISLERGVPPLNSRSGDQALKEAPCGTAGSTRGTNIYTYAPGETITVSLLEYIPHPSYFRIAFDNDGDDGFKDPASIKPIDPARKCPDGPGDFCGASDFYNTPAVLKGMDNLDPHLADYSKPPPVHTWQVTLPDVECDNCTLQVIQVMEDDAAHGPYDPTPGSGVPDIYHQCVDLVLKAGADGGGAGPGPGSTKVGASSGDSGGCAVSRPGSARSAGAEWALIAMTLGCYRVWRRRS